MITNRIILPRSEMPYVIPSVTFVTNEGFPVKREIRHVLYKNLPKDLFSIPVGRTDLIRDVESHGRDIRIRKSADIPEHSFTLREDQSILCDSINDNAVINASVGFGKSIVAASLIKKFGMKSLIIVHSKFLLDQWIENIKKYFGMEPGVITAGRVSFMNRPIVVGNVQSLVKYIKEISMEFGTVILDEAHHVPATTFSSIIDASCARYKLALSATLERRDGRGRLVRDYFSWNNVIVPTTDNTIPPIIYRMNTGLKIPGGSSWPDRLTKLIRSPEYVHFLLLAITVAARKGHKVLVHCDRVELAETLHDHLPNSVLVLGRTEDRLASVRTLDSGENDIVISTVFKEGISENYLSALVLASPVANGPALVQLMGRIMRKHEGKITPEVYDPMFTCYTGRSQASIRLGVYVQKGYKIHNV